MKKAAVLSLTHFTCYLLQEECMFVGMWVFNADQTAIGNTTA
jgi:hypothetical protein